MSEFSIQEGFNPQGDAARSREQHLYDDLDSGPDAHHHSIGNGPDQATSLPLAKQVFDGTYAGLQHTHPEIAGDNLIVNGDASDGINSWTILTTNASGTTSVGDFLSQLSADASQVIWQSNVFTPVALENMSGNITYHGDTLATRLRVYVAWRTDTSDPAVDGTITPTAGTSLDFVGQRSITTINVDQVWAFSWEVPATALRGRLIIVWDDDTVAAGFPLNCYHDDVQLVSNLTTVSKLYVGVTGSQRMEGPLTIDGNLNPASVTSPLILPDTLKTPEFYYQDGNQGLGKVLISDADGKAQWGDSNPTIYIGDTAPASPAVGQGWWDTSESVTDPILYKIVRNGIFMNNPATTGTWTDATPTIGKYRLNIPCDGVLVCNLSLIVYSNNGNAGMGWGFGSPVNCSYGDLGGLEARSGAQGGFSSSAYGMANAVVYNVTPGATIDFSASYIATAASSYFSYLRAFIMFYPKMQYVGVDH